MMTGEVGHKASQGFIAEPLCIKFSGSEELEDYLDSARATRPLLIRRPEDVLLSLDGLIQQRYRLTPWGLWGLCRRLSPNLNSVISDLLGTDNKRPAFRNIKPDNRSAVSVLNTIIRSRFSQVLEGSRLIVDPVRRTIDGIVGRRYLYFSNLQLYRSSSKFAANNGGSLISASLFGRRLLLRYSSSDVCLEALGKPYCTGWAFSNSETGQSAMKAGILLVDKHQHSSMRMIFRRTHTKSLETEFDEWLQQKMHEATGMMNWKGLQKNLEHLSTIPIPYEQDTAKDLAEILWEELCKTIPRPVSRRIAQEVYSPPETYVGSPAWQPPTSPLPTLRLKPQYALYEALTVAAGDCQAEAQETAECLAYEFLRGRFNPFGNK